MVRAEYNEHMTNAKLTNTEKNLRAHVARIAFLKARNAAWDARCGALLVAVDAQTVRVAALLDK